MTDDPSQQPKIELQLLSSNVVIIANELNLSIFRPVWMCEEGILSPEEIGEGVLISPAAIQIPCSEFSLTIFPNRLQLSLPHFDVEANLQVINRVLCGTLKLLPHTPLAAVGLNFELLVRPTGGQSFLKWNEEIFGAPFARAISDGVDSAPRFGAYYSMHFGEFRVKCDMKPILLGEDIIVRKELGIAHNEWMKFDCNYHCNLPREKAAEHATTHVSKWNDCYNHVKILINKLSNL